MLREDTHARLESGILRRRLVSGPRSLPVIARLGPRALMRAQEHEPVAVAADERRTWWMFRERFFWEDDGLEADEVMALIHERERRLRRRIDRAKDAMARDDGGDGAPRRPAIPEEVRREVFRRHGGRCAGCGSDELLQFDHVIPIALGGASGPENLQLLCAPCNRSKGAAL